MASSWELVDDAGAGPRLESRVVDAARVAADGDGAADLGDVLDRDPVGLVAVGEPGVDRGDEAADDSAEPRSERCGSYEHGGELVPAVVAPGQLEVVDLGDH